MRRLPGRLVACGLCTILAGGPAQAASLECHFDYGGERSTQQVEPTPDPYTTPTRRHGSYFLTRTVWEANPGAQAVFKLYVYGDTPDGPVLIQQAEWPLPVFNAATGGFTGLQRVYEPRLDGELTYWCEVRGGPR